jgi:hypothetical protein
MHLPARPHREPLKGFRGGSISTEATLNAGWMDEGCMLRAAVTLPSCSYRRITSDLILCERRAAALAR